MDVAEHGADLFVIILKILERERFQWDESFP